MQRTIIAVFDNRGDAQSAFDALEAAGFTGGQVRLSEGDPTGSPSSNIGHGHGATGTGGTGVLDGIRNFFGTLFGTDDSEHVQKYSDAVTRGHQVLTLTATIESDIERAVGIVERFGPVDIDEKSSEWSGGALASEAMRGGADAQQRSASMSRQSTQGTQGTQATSQGSRQGGSEPGSQQFAAGGGSSAGGRGGEHLPGRTLNETEAAIEADEEYYLGHYNTAYAAAGGQYEDYGPAYKYGTDMANNETYRGRAWRDVEPQLRTDWEGRYPGSAWAKIKDAVRHGWERITH
jgi:hypothetical protein